MNAKQRVANSLAILEEHMPDWDTFIDLDALNIYSCTDCVLGQVFGGYGAGLRILGIETSPNCGFTPTQEVTGAELKEEWVRVISERREARVRELVPA